MLKNSFIKICIPYITEQNTVIDEKRAEKEAKKIAKKMIKSAEYELAYSGSVFNHKESNWEVYFYFFYK